MKIDWKHFNQNQIIKVGGGISVIFLIPTYSPLFTQIELSAPLIYSLSVSNDDKYTIKDITIPLFQKQLQCFP